MTEAAAWRLFTRGSLYLVGLAAAIWLIVELQTLVFQVFLAVIMACSVDPIVGRIMPVLQARAGLRKLGRGPVVVVIFALGGLIALVVVVKVAAVVVGEIAQFSDLVAQQSAAWEQQLIALANQLGIPAELVTGVVNQIQSGLDWLVQVVQVLLGVFGGFLSVVFTVIIAIYLASDADHILESIVGLLPRDNRVKIDATLRFTGQRLGRWVIAQVIVASIVSAIWAVGLYFLGIPYIGFLTLIAFMAEFVPLVGPFISSIPTIFVAFATTTPAQGVATALFCLVVEQLENDLIVPRAMSTATTVHPLVVLLAILAGGQLFGPFGALLAVPFATCISVFLSAYRQQEISPELEGVDVGNNL